MCVYFIALLLIYSCFGMEHNKVDFTTLLQTDVQCLIIDYLLREDEIAQSFKDIVSASRVNKSLHTLICNDKPYAIQSLAKKMNMYPQGVAVHLCRLEAMSKNIMDSYLDTTLNESLRKAVSKGHKEKVVNLLQRKANANFEKDVASCKSPQDLFAEALRKGHEEVASQLIKAGFFRDYAGKDYVNMVSFWMGQRRNEPEKMKQLYNLLISSGINVNGQSADMYLITPLMRSVINDCVVGVELILKQQPNLYITNAKGETAYDIAVSRGRAQIAELIKAKMDEQNL